MAPGLSRRVLEVDQDADRHRRRRSCPATYVGFWDAIRRLFADTTEARMRGWSASLPFRSTRARRCDECEGQGMKKIAMSFLPAREGELRSLRRARASTPIRWP